MSEVEDDYESAKENFPQDTERLVTEEGKSVSPLYADIIFTLSCNAGERNSHLRAISVHLQTL